MCYDQCENKIFTNASWTFDGVPYVCVGSGNSYRHLLKKLTNSFRNIGWHLKNN